MRHRNLILLCDAAVQPDRDFREVAKRVRRLAPDVHAFVVSTPEERRRPALAQLLRPTLFVQVHKVAHMRPRRGCVARPLDLSKIETFRAMDAAGLPVPRWTEITPGLRLDPAEWGEYVIVKPDRGRRGAYVFPVKTERVRYKPPESYPEEHFGRAGPMIAQRFVYTGPYPTAIRVLTCFGEPIAATQATSVRGNAPLSGPAGFAEGLRPVVASSRRSDVSYCTEADVLALARRIHEPFPLQPLIGCDLMRDALTGELWIAEINLVDVWYLSTPAGIAVQAQFGLDLYAQFGALDRAAEALVRAARQFAR